MAREQLKNLTEPMYYILLSLMQDNHGYGIMQMPEAETAATSAAEERRRKKGRKKAS